MMRKIEKVIGIATICLLFAVNLLAYPMMNSVLKAYTIGSSVFAVLFVPLVMRIEQHWSPDQRTPILGIVFMAPCFGLGWPVFVPAILIAWLADKTKR